MQGLFGWIWFTCLALWIFSRTKRGVAYISRHGWNLRLTRWLLATGFVIALATVVCLGYVPPPQTEPLPTIAKLLPMPSSNPIS
jgi:hypothetical protein